VTDKVKYTISSPLLRSTVSTVAIKPSQVGTLICCFILPIGGSSSSSSSSATLALEVAFAAPLLFLDFLFAGVSSESLTTSGLSLVLGLPRFLGCAGSELSSRVADLRLDFGFESIDFLPAILFFFCFRQYSSIRSPAFLRGC